MFPWGGRIEKPIIYRHLYLKPNLTIIYNNKITIKRSVTFPLK